MRKILLSIILLTVCQGLSQAQQKYWIYLKDKMDDSQAENSFTDVPVSSIYIDSLYHFGINPIVKSKWLNAISAKLSPEQIGQLNQLAFVADIQSLKGKFTTSSVVKKGISTSKVLEQINADTLIQLGLTGNGVKIGIIDAGFLNANKDDYLQGIIQGNKVIAYRNFIDAEITNPYEGDIDNNDWHGTNVFKAIAGMDNEIYIGLASNSEFYLARTDEEQRENRAEEDYWIAAMEWMYDEGVRVINSSLGYSDGFDNPEENYEPKNIDGSFSAITRAVNVAVKEKGMTIILSAGNDGNRKFKLISIPSDAKGIISVGASGYRFWDKQNYSSIGPEDYDIKPEVSCYATDGTSFSAPVITGLVACMIEYKPTLKNHQILEIIKKSSHLHPYPNNYLGYGIPNGTKIIALLNNPDKVVSNTEEVIASPINGYSITLPKSNNIMAFHKKNKTIVIEQEKLKWSNGQITVKPVLGAEYTTVATEDHVWEIQWIK